MKGITIFEKIIMQIYIVNQWKDYPGITLINISVNYEEKILSVMLMGIGFGFHLV